MKSLSLHTVVVVAILLAFMSSIIESCGDNSGTGTAASRAMHDEFRTMVRDFVEQRKQMRSNRRAPPPTANNDNIKSKPRIVGGVEVPDGGAPHTVAIYFLGFFNCAGALIGPKHVLTSAHCNEFGVCQKLLFSILTFILFLLSLSLSRPESPSMSPAYIRWCTTRSVGETPPR